MLMEDGTHQVQFTNEEQLADFRKLQNNAHDIYLHLLELLQDPLNKDILDALARNNTAE